MGKHLSFYLSLPPPGAVPPIPGSLTRPVIPPDPMTAILEGRVRDDLGTPLPGATVNITQSGTYIAARSPGSAPIITAGRSYTIQSGKDGTFRLDRLAQGTYIVCAHGPAKYHLSSCEWGGRSSYVLVEAAAKKTIPDFVVPNGDVIRIEVLDAGDRLASEGKSPIGISIPGVFFRRAYRASRIGSVTAYEIAVPRNRAMILRWESKLQASDSKGAAFGLERDLGSVLQRDGIGQAKLSIRID